MSKHTPGPWSDRSIHDPILIHGADEVGLSLAFVACDGGDPRRDEFQANARLITAAPDLLAVLKELRECAYYWTDYDVPIGIQGRIDAAITKATGDE